MVTQHILSEDSRGKICNGSTLDNPLVVEMGGSTCLHGSFVHDLHSHIAHGKREISMMHS